MTDVVTGISHDSPTFCRLLATDWSDELLVDLAIDSPPHDLPTVTLLGPTMGPLELAGRKLLALFGPAEARDFADDEIPFSAADVLKARAYFAAWANELRGNVG